MGNNILTHNNLRGMQRMTEQDEEEKLIQEILDNCNSKQAGVLGNICDERFKLNEELVQAKEQLINVNTEKQELIKQVNHFEEELAQAKEDIKLAVKHSDRQTEYIKKLEGELAQAKEIIKKLESVFKELDSFQSSGRSTDYCWKLNIEEEEYNKLKKKFVMESKQK